MPLYTSYRTAVCFRVLLFLRRKSGRKNVPTGWDILFTCVYSRFTRLLFHWVNNQESFAPPSMITERTPGELGRTERGARNYRGNYRGNYWGNYRGSRGNGQTTLVNKDELIKNRLLLHDTSRNKPRTSASRETGGYRCNIITGNHIK